MNRAIVIEKEVAIKNNFEIVNVVPQKNSGGGVATSAYKAIRGVKQRPVDILVGTKSRFDERKNQFTVENEVFHKGVLLYGSAS